MVQAGDVHRRLRDVVDGLRTQLHDQDQALSDLHRQLREKEAMVQVLAAAADERLQLIKALTRAAQDRQALEAERGADGASPGA